MTRSILRAWLLFLVPVLVGCGSRSDAAIIDRWDAAIWRLAEASCRAFCDRHYGGDCGAALDERCELLGEVRASDATIACAKEVYLDAPEESQPTLECWVEWADDALRCASAGQGTIKQCLATAGRCPSFNSELSDRYHACGLKFYYNAAVSVQNNACDVPCDAAGSEWVWFGFTCDGEQDCENGADEAGCGSATCDDGEPIWAEDICDGSADCSEGEDELGCFCVG